MFSLDFGGAENYTISLMNEFVKLGHNVKLRVLSKKVPLIDRLDEKIVVEVWSRKKKLDISVLKKIKSEIKEGEYDAIISSYVIYQKIATIFLNNIPLTLYPIHSTVQRRKKYDIFNFIIFRMKKKNEIFLASITSQTKYLIDAYNLKKDTFNQIPNGVDTNKFILPLPEFNRGTFLSSKGIKNSNLIILMIAGFREEKRYIDCINAFSLLKEELENVSLVLVGNNDLKEYEKLFNYSNSKGISDIHIFTAGMAGDVKKYYWSADLFTLTSNKVETFPISALEAMASGLPCVLTDVGGAKDFIDDKFNGLISKPNDIIDIKNKWLKALLSERLKDKLKIREYVVNNYSIVDSAKSYLNLIREHKK